MPTLRAIDPGGNAGRAAAEARFALGLGDTRLAAAKFREAAGTLIKSADAARGAPSRNLMRFLAASQLYQGGDYKQAFRLGKRVEARFLPAATKDSLSDFLKEAGRRASPGYAEGVRRRLVALRENGDARQLTDALSRHPYVYDPSALAFLRATLCESMGDWRAAADFYAQAIRFEPKAWRFAVMAAGGAIRLQLGGQGKEASEYVKTMKGEMPGAYSSMAATAISFWQAEEAAPAERAAMYRELLAEFDRAWTMYRELPEVQRADGDVKTLMSLSFDAALVAMMRAGDPEQALSFAGEALAFFPDGPTALTVRGVATYPSAGAVADFRRASTQPGVGYAPFYFLAHEAFHRGDPAEAELMCLEALRHGPMGPLRAQLTAWLAAFKDSLGAGPEVVARLFQEATEIDPGNELVEALYGAYLAREGAQSEARSEHWRSSHWDGQITSARQRYNFGFALDRVKSGADQVAGSVLAGLR